MDSASTSDLPSDPHTSRMRLEFAERNWQRAKEENLRLIQKITKMSQDAQAWQQEKNTLLQTIASLQRRISRGQNEKQGLQKKLQLRTMRHHAEQSQNLTHAEKAIIQKKVSKSEVELLSFRHDYDQLAAKNQKLLSELDQERKDNTRIREQVLALQKQNIADLDKIQHLERLFQEKVRILEQEKRVLEKQTESLMLEVKMLERKQSIEQLLSYEDNIGSLALKPTHGRTSTGCHSDWWLQSARPNDQSDQKQMEEELRQRDELIELLKEKGIRKEMQLCSLRERCAVLQDAVCGRGFRNNT